MFGWIFRKTRKAHGIAVFLVLFSWLGLGSVFGWGYCLLTEWQWEIKEILGETGLPDSLIGYFLRKVGIAANRTSINIGACGIMVVLTILTLVLNIRDVRKKKNFLC